MTDRVYHLEFAELHSSMEAVYAKYDSMGWPSPDFKNAATCLRMGLWELAHNKLPTPSLLEALAKWSAEFEHERSGS